MVLPLLNFSTHISLSFSIEELVPPHLAYCALFCLCWFRYSFFLCSLERGELRILCTAPTDTLWIFFVWPLLQVVSCCLASVVPSLGKDLVTTRHREHIDGIAKKLVVWLCLKSSAVKELRLNQRK